MASNTTDYLASTTDVVNCNCDICARYYQYYHYEEIVIALDKTGALKDRHATAARIFIAVSAEVALLHNKVKNFTQINSLNPLADDGLGKNTMGEDSGLARAAREALKAGLWQAYGNYKGDGRGREGNFVGNFMNEYFKELRKKTKRVNWADGRKVRIKRTMF